jgi:hypothetical protein
MRIIIEILLIAIIIGVGIMYVLSPKPDIIFKLPNETNLYVDTNNVCYRYKKKYNK